MVYKGLRDGLPKHYKTIKVDVKTWNSLKSLKKENETFDDVIKVFLDQRTKEAGNNRIKAIKYERKTAFLRTSHRMTELGIEFEYNDIKNQKTDFVLDLKIKKIFFGKKAVNPSIFFGLTHEQKHLSIPYLNIYLRCISYALRRELKVNTHMEGGSEYESYEKIDSHFEDIVAWKSVYHEYDLSMESFTQDIEDPLNLSEEEEQTEKEKKSIKESISFSISKWSF